MPSSPTSAMVPYADQYVGVWAILDRTLNALVKQAQNINLQLHVEQAGEPDKRSEIEARGSARYEVTADGVAVVELHGSLQKQASSFSGGASMVAARRAVRAATRDPDVAAILLHIDSPGGTVAGTVDLADDVAAAAKEKPVHAYIEDLGASAAYWIASQATKIHANRSAEVGSIGVFSVITDWSQYAENEGAKVHVVRFGQFKGAGVGGTEVTDEQLAEWQKQVDAFGDMFVEAVATGRGMAAAQAKQLADGRIHPAAEAVDLKLIDGVKTFDEAHAELAGVARSGNSATRQENPMSTETNEPQAPQSATLKELKELMPKASSDFVLEQLEAGATATAALQAYNAFLAEENDRLAAEKEDAEKKAAAGQAATATRKAGNAPVDAAAEDDQVATDYRQLAKDLAKSRGVSYRQAARLVQKEHGADAREAFKVGTLPG